MFKRFAAWRMHRRLQHTIQQNSWRGPSYSATQLPCSGEHAPARQIYAPLLAAWLEHQLASAKPSYGMLAVVIALRFVAQTEHSRRTLYYETFTLEHGSDTPLVLQSARHSLTSAAQPAAATHVELYVFNAGHAVHGVMETVLSI